MTKYEYYIKEARGGKLRPEDLRVILMFGRNIEYPTPSEEEEASRLISEKHINLSVLGASFLAAKNGAKRYNGYCKKVTDCLSSAQYDLLKKYYSSIAKERGDK